MKKLFTLVALMACFLGAKAEWVEDYSIDYSSKKGFPFYVMGYVPEWYDGVMTDFGANYKYVTLDNEAGETSDVTVKTDGGTEYYKIALSEPGWHQYFLADGIPTELDGAYTVKAMVKASEACSINVNMGWGWGDGQTVSATVAIGTDWQEVEWNYTGIGGTSCNLVAQPGTVTATIEWKYLKVSHNAKAQRPVEWIEHLTNGDAEKAWADPAMAFTDANNITVCAWGKENAGEPHPATIEEADADHGHVFVVHATDCADPSADASAWDNQFWIESPQGWKSGTQIRISFDYKASQACNTNTQMHHQNPSDYQIWYAIGDVAFTTEWQHFEKTITIDDSQANAYSVAFNLNPDVKTATDFYFDNLKWETMKLDEGYFVAGSNAAAGVEYDFDNAVQFAEDGDGNLVATIGEKGAYVSQIMVSTVRGNDAAFKGATLKPSSVNWNKVTDDYDDYNWNDYSAVAVAKINLPAAGIWKVYLDTEYLAMAFVMLEGDAPKEPITIVPNPTVVTVAAVERDYKGADSDGNAQEAGIGSGQPWDNQFWIFANRTIEAGEEVTIEFDYVADKEAKTTTQLHGLANGGTYYLHWSAIGDVTFTTTEQHFSKTFAYPADGAKLTCDGGTVEKHGIAFNMAEIKEACNYTIKNVVFKTSDSTETLINMDNGQNFWLKIGAGTAPYPFETSGIKEATVSTMTSTASYNLAGQRVAKNYKGIVIKNGSKYVAK